MKDKGSSVEIIYADKESIGNATTSPPSKNNEEPYCPDIDHLETASTADATVGSFADFARFADFSEEERIEERKSDSIEEESTKTKKKSSLTLGSFTLILTFGFCIFALWKWAFGSPTTLSEARRGFEDWWSNAKNFTASDFKDVLKDGLKGMDFGDAFANDPRVGDNATYVWRGEYVRPDEGGLHLTILNALDETWQREFMDAVGDWKESTALQLTEVRVEVDHNCNRVDGVLVVCNANFGETGWVGINENELVDGIIYSSVAKMNEYYLRNAEYDHRRYTMCHEIGHGFGLPHTDENPYNSDLGNCLDYTTTPKNNLYPGYDNYKKLHEMYNMYNSRRLKRETGNGRVIETHVLYLDERWEEVERDLVEEGDSYEVLEDWQEDY